MTKKGWANSQKPMYKFHPWPTHAICICGHTKKQHMYFNPNPYIRAYLPCSCKGSRACDCLGFVPESTLWATDNAVPVVDDGLIYRRISLD